MKESTSATIAENVQAIGIALEHHQAGRLAEAEENYRKILATDPDNVAALHYSGLLAYQSGNHDQAVELISRAIKHHPFDAIARNNLGGVLKNQGKWDEAVACYQKAVTLKPDYAEAHYNLGCTLHAQGKWNDAVACYRQALSIKPDYFEAYTNLGGSFHAQGKWDDAMACYRNALALKPDYVEAHYNLGVTLNEQGKWDDAIACYRRALVLQPDYAEAHYNLGVAFNANGKQEEAIACYQQAVALKPDYTIAHDNLLMTMQYVRRYTAADLLAAHVRFGDQVEAPLKPAWPAHRNPRTPNKHLKVGYVSGDFRRHAVAYFIEPVLANHDRAQIEVFCYYNNLQQDPVSDRLAAHADHWLPCKTLSDDQLAERIRADGIDILVDLAGHTAHNRLLTFARKPAPIQLTYLGYPSTSGLSAMDYRLTDACADPHANDANYREQLLRLPHSLWCYRPAADMPDITPLPALSNGFLTFGSFNNINKIDDQCLQLWAALLRALPSARLLMVTVPEGELRQRLAQQFQALGVAAERLEFHGKLAPAAFQRMIQRADIALDPFPVNGATTTCESLWLGVPVMALVGTRFLARAGLSIMNAAGLQDFTATTEEQYIRIPALLAENPQLLAGIRAGLRAHLAASPLMDDKGFTRNLENIYRDIWNRWCAAAA